MKIAHYSSLMLPRRWRFETKARLAADRYPTRTPYRIQPQEAHTMHCLDPKKVWHHQKRSIAEYGESPLCSLFFFSLPLLSSLLHLLCVSTLSLFFFVAFYRRERNRLLFSYFCSSLLLHLCRDRQLDCRWCKGRANRATWYLEQSPWRMDREGVSSRWIEALQIF